jgi:SAM-dependent MidA family methyltransferase
LREQQSQILEPFRDKVEWRSSFEPFVGVHFSNELLDALPVRLISGGVEKLVDIQGDKFLFIERPLSSTAFNQASLDWMDSVAANLERGYVITIDYGHSGNEFQGSVQVRAQHRLLDSPFEQIGHADITIQVDWTSIARRAEASGLRVAGFTDQHHFLTGIVSELGRGGSPEPLAGDRGQSPLSDSPKTKRALQTLLHPEMLGRAFQVLALAKNVDSGAPQLAGFKFAREPRAALGLKEPNQ